MFEARSGSAEIDENDVNEALDARTEILRGKRYRLRWDVTSKWKVRREDRREGRAKPRVRSICSTKLVRVAGMFCSGREVK